MFLSIHPSHLFKKCTVFQTTQIWSSPCLAILPSKEEHLILWHIQCVCVYIYVRQCPGKLADESCPLSLPHNTNMTFVSRNVYIWNKEEELLNSFTCCHSKPIIEIINSESSCLKNKAARNFFFKWMVSSILAQAFLWWRKDSVLEEWEEGSGSAFSGSHACLTWWRKSTLTVVV